MIQFDKLVNQIIIKAIKIEGTTISKNIFDDLIIWILGRQYKTNYYLQEGLESIPVIILSNTNDMMKYSLDFNFKNIRVLEKEFDNKDISVYLKYYKFKDFR